ncbi:hypothetical protein AAMO2058_000445100 [Amorphochlora amoebiformis]|eukprot:1374272-Amorphochlora_amoeboformis.AAC.1
MLGGMEVKKGIKPNAAIKTLMARKAQIEDDLKSTERQIFDLEESYIIDTSHYGNVIKGWEGYQSAKPKQTHNVRKPKIIDKDRIFSESSTTAPKVMEDGMELEDLDHRPQRSRQRTSTRNKNFSYSDDDEAYEE